MRPGTPGPLIRGLATFVAFVALLAAVRGAAAQSLAVPPNGIVCTTSADDSFALTATDGYISLPDGNSVYMWSFASGTGPFQHPGPVLCVDQGDTVTITLSNTLAQPVSLIFPGQSDVLANGVPSQPQFSGATLTSLAPAAPTGGSVTYQFVASEPGTYLYESGTNPGVQVQMGLFGAIVVRPAGHPDWVYADASTAFDPAHEYLMLLSEIDPYLHMALERGQSYDMGQYRPRYFLINGRSFPDTIAPNGAAWLPDQPYGALAHIYPYDPVTNPLPALVRYVGVGSADFPFHPHGNHSRVVGRDGRPLRGDGGEDLSYEKFSLPIGPGQTWDVTFSWHDAENFSPSNPIPVTVPNQQNLFAGAYWSGSPYLGGTGTLPVGGEGYNQCGEYYHVAHNHALTQITSWGLTMSGMMTYTRIDPPEPNSCP